MISKLSQLPSWIYLTGILLISILLRLPLLSGSFWLDEAAQALESARPFSQQLLIRDDFQPPLLHFLVHFALYFGNSEWWLRTVGAFIPGLLTIYFTFRIGEILGGKRLALLSSLLLATSSFHVFYSQELRQYSLPAAFAIATWYLILKQGSHRAPSLGILASYALLTAAGLYSSYLYPFALMGQGIWILLNNRSTVWRWGVSVVVSLVAFLPWLPSFLDQLKAGAALRESLPGWASVVSPTQVRALPLVVVKFLYGVQDVEVSAFFVISAVILLIFQILLLKDRKPLAKKRTVLMPLSIWLVAPIAVAWLVSFWVPVLQPKRVLFSLPAFYLLISTVSLTNLSNIKDHTLKSVPVLFYSLFLVINLVGLFQYWTTPKLQRENWRSLVETIENQYPQRSVTLFAFPEPFAPWRWYADASYPAIATQELLLTDVKALEAIKLVTNYDHVLVFDYLRDLSDPERKLDSLLLEYGYKETDLLEYPVIGFIRIYSKPTAVISYN